jgi:hypothetical protein
MADEIPAQPLARDRGSQGVATRAYMARYDVARRQSVRDYLSSCGDRDSELASNRGTDDPACPADQTVAVVAVRAGKKIRSLVRLFNSACRRAYECVAL